MIIVWMLFWVIVMDNSIFDSVDFRVLNKYIKDNVITDIICRNNNEVWITSNSKGHYRVNIKITKEDIDMIANQVANKMEKEFNPFNPCLEGDIVGDKVDLRVSAIHDYLANDGTSLAIRKVSKKSKLSIDYLVDSGYCTRESIEFLISATKAKANIIIVGETGCGKTELLKFLATHIPSDQVIVTIEDSLEFNIKDINPKASCTAFRVKKDFDYSSIIAMSLRQNVSRLLIQEARGREVADLLDAMSSGHSVMTTIHALGSDSLGIRVKQMLHDTNESLDSINMRLFSLVDIVVYLKKNTSDSVTRYISTISEFQYDYSNNLCVNRVLYNGKGKLKRVSSLLGSKIYGV